MKEDSKKPVTIEQKDTDGTPDLSETAQLLEGWTPELQESQQADGIPEDPAGMLIDDPKTDEAVEDIAATEADELLAVEDAIKKAEDEPEPRKQSLSQRLKAFWAKPVVRWATAITTAVVIIAAVVVPQIRYFILNTVGVRASSSVTVIDITTQQPLKNTQVRIGSAEGMTDGEGHIALTGIKLGKQRLHIHKIAFAEIDRSITVGWGSNPLGTVELDPTGAQYTFSTVDAVSGQPLGRVELASGQANARSDENGQAILTVERPDERELSIEVSMDGFRTDTVTIPTNTSTTTTVKLAPSRKHVFMSKRDGSADLYSIYADGKHEELLLKATGYERDDDMTLVPHLSESVVAYVSTRGNQANSDGYLLSNLILIDTETGDTTSIATSERINIIGWSGDHLVYVQIAEGRSAPRSDRYRLISHDHTSGQSTELAKTDYLNDVILFAGHVYYAPHGGHETASVDLYRVNVDGSNNRAFFGREVWNIIRTGYQELALLTTDQQWFTYMRGDAEPRRRSAAPASQRSRTYVDSPDGKHSLWVDVRDGKGVLLAYELGTRTEKVVAETIGLSYPVRWINDHVIVYRVVSPTESAEYVVSLEGGSPHKLTDITTTRGLGN